MLNIQRSVLLQLSQAFLNNKDEQGFLLGSSSQLEELDCCYQVPAIQASTYFYTPDAEKADVIIQKWAEQNVCFCGFVHSHVVEKNNLSENDIEFARQLFRSYKLPILWFGLGIVQKGTVQFRFYSVTGNKDYVKIDPIYWMAKDK